VPGPPFTPISLPSGPHFLVDPADVDADRAVLSGDDGRHLAAVLRARPGMPVSLADGAGRRWAGRVTGVDGAEVRLAVADLGVEPMPVPAVTVVHALPKGRKLDDVVQRLTEVGVERLVPVRSARSEVELTPQRAEKAVARWRAVARAAAKQSRRARVLEVADVGEWTAAWSQRGPGVVCWEQATAPLRAVLPAGADTLVVGIGPEGGLTEAEVEVSGLPAASLGPTVLRTETAALVAVTAILTLTGRLG